MNLLTPRVLFWSGFIGLSEEHICLLIETLYRTCISSILKGSKELLDAKKCENNGLIDNEQSPFCSKIRDGRNANINGAEREEASGETAGFVCVLPRRFPSKRETAHSLWSEFLEKVLDK